MKFTIKKLNEHGFDHVVMLVVFLVTFSLIGSWFLYQSFAATTYVLLHIGSYSGACVNGTTLVNCNTSGTSSEQTWDTISGGSMPSLEGSNFHIKNRANQCIQNVKGPRGNYVGSNATNRVYLSVGSCSSGNSYQKWNWSNHRLVNVASGGCINSLGGAESANTSLLVYTCNGGNNETFWDKSVNVSSSGGGGGSTSNSAEQSALCKQFGYSGNARYNRDCSNIGTALNYMTAAGSNFHSWAISSQEECLGELWNRESTWDSLIINPTSGAFGIAQALTNGYSGVTATYKTLDIPGGTETAPAGKVYSVRMYPSYVANDGQALYQEIWGLQYIQGRYGSPCAAWSHETGVGWYVTLKAPSGVEVHS